MSTRSPGRFWRMSPAGWTLNSLILSEIPPASGQTPLTWWGRMEQDRGTLNRHGLGENPHSLESLIQKSQSDALRNVSHSQRCPAERPISP